jgi:hypothetical protein
MDISFTDLSDVPLPADEVRFRKLSVIPLPDGRRVRVEVELSPFQKQPDIDLDILDEQDEIVASTSIIESMTRKIELTMHLRGVPPGSTCRLQATLLFTSLPEPGPEKQPEPIERTVVDRAETAFTTPDAAYPK